MICKTVEKGAFGRGIAGGFLRISAFREGFSGFMGFDVEISGGREYLELDTLLSHPSRKERGMDGHPGYGEVKGRASIFSGWTHFSRNLGELPIPGINSALQYLRLPFVFRGGWMSQ